MVLFEKDFLSETPGLLEKPGQQSGFEQSGESTVGALNELCPACDVVTVRVSKFCHVFQTFVPIDDRERCLMTIQRMTFCWNGASLLSTGPQSDRRLLLIRQARLRPLQYPNRGSPPRGISPTMRHLS